MGISLTVSDAGQLALYMRAISIYEHAAALGPTGAGTSYSLFCSVCRDAQREDQIIVGNRQGHSTASAANAGIPS